MKREPWWVALLVAAVLLPLAPPPDSVPLPFDRAGRTPLAIGIHAPNRGWNEQDYARVAEGEFDAVKMMGYHPLESYARLREALPDLQFFVRLTTQWNELPDPDQFAAANVPSLRALVAGGYAPWVEIGNEPNLELHPQAEATFAAWYLQVLSRLRAAVPEARYGFPGLARDLRESQWLAANAAAIQASDWLGVHAYWFTEREMLDPKGGLRLVEYHRQFPTVPIVVTEAGSHQGRLSSEARGTQYARFIRTLARLPYVRAVHFFILSGTGEWRGFFFDQTMVAKVREAGRDPLPPLIHLLGFQEPRKRVRPLASVPEALAMPTPLPSPTSARRADATPTPEPFTRRRLLADATPAAASGRPAPQSRWVALPPAPGPAARLRSASAFTASDFSVRLSIAAPDPGEPFAVQIAEADLFAPPTVGLPAAPPTAAPASPAATGFALLWDGGQWRLQYRRAGVLGPDVPLAAPPAAAGAWLQVELALETRSAAAWIWPRGARQPEIPDAVFAPPEAAALDGARPRSLFLPAHPLADVLLEGATRYS